MGKTIFTFKVQHKLLSKNNHNKYLKPCLGARMIHPSVAVILEQMHVYSGWGKRSVETELRNIPSPTQYIPVTTLLHTLWKPKLSPDFAKCTHEHKAVPG